MVAFRHSIAASSRRRDLGEEPMTHRSDHHRFDRREFLEIAAVAGAAMALCPVNGSDRRSSISGLARWSDRASWGREALRTGDSVSISGRVLLDEDVQVSGLTIQQGGELVFHPHHSRTLESTGNVVVEGRLAMQPSSPQEVHRIVFRGVDERAFVGGGMDVLDSDIGLWVMGHGRLRLKGSRRRAWTRSDNGVPAGTRDITLQDEPDGWRVGDELVITPTRAPGGGGNTTTAESYDYANVRSISERTVRLSSATRFHHPALNVGTRDLGPEVLNLTRNVQIEGTPGGRSHVFIHSSQRQVVKQTSIRYAGPRQAADEFTEDVLGRYGLHFHLCENGSRRSVVKGTVVRDCGGHAFVPHTSHGVSFVDCISHDTFDDAYWWDQAPDTRTPGARTDDVLYSRCVASLVRSDPEFRGYRLAGFNLGRGRGSVASGCVAVGVQGNENASGFTWPEGSEGIWGFENNVAHNNSVNGIFVWQNTDRHHLINRFIAFHNGQAGVEHGAYLNSYVFRDMQLVGNGLAGVLLHAGADHQGSLRFEDVTVDGRGITSYGFLGAEPVLEGGPATICDPSITGVTDSDYALDYSGDSLDDRFSVQSSG